MSNEEFERKMEFILEQQAQFAANQQAHDARFTRLENHVGELVGIVTSLANVTLEGFKDVNAKIDALVDSQIRLTENQERLAESQEQMAKSQEYLAKSQERLAKSQAETEEKLKNLIAAVDRYLEGRDGRA